MEEYESEIPEFTEAELEDYIGEGHLTPILTETRGVDASAEVYELNGRLILTWSAHEGTDSGFEVLLTQSLDEARVLARDKASEITDEYEQFDSFLELGTLAGFGGHPDQFYPLPDDYLRIGTYELISDYDLGTQAEIHVFRCKSGTSDVGRSILVYSADIGLVVGEFDSMEEVQEEVIEETPGFTLNYTEIDRGTE